MLCKYCGQKYRMTIKIVLTVKREVVLENPEEFVDCDQPNTPPTGNQGRRWPFVLQALFLFWRFFF